jgi:hypothetical protein
VFSDKALLEVRFQVFTAVSIEFLVFWTVAMCNVVVEHQRLNNPENQEL